MTHDNNDQFNVDSLLTPAAQPPKRGRGRPRKEDTFRQRVQEVQAQLVNNQSSVDSNIRHETNKQTTPPAMPVTRSGSQERAPRSVTSIRAAARNRDSLEIPQEITAYYDKMGYTLRWVSTTNSSKIQSNERINYFIAVGGAIVTPQEVRALDPTFLSGLTPYEYREDFLTDEDRSKGSTLGIKKGTLVLMKLPKEYREMKQQDSEEAVRGLLYSTQREYLRQGGEVKDMKIKSGLVNTGRDFFK